MLLLFICVQNTIFKCLKIMVSNNFPLAIILRILRDFNEERVELFLMMEGCATAFLAKDKSEECMVSVVIRNVNPSSLCDSFCLHI